MLNECLKSFELLFFYIWHTICNVIEKDIYEFLEKKIVDIQKCMLIWCVKFSWFFLNLVSFLIHTIFSSYFFQTWGCRDRTSIFSLPSNQARVTQFQHRRRIDLARRNPQRWQPSVRCQLPIRFLFMKTKQKFPVKRKHSEPNEHFSPLVTTGAGLRNCSAYIYKYDRNWYHLFDYLFAIRCCIGVQWLFVSIFWKFFPFL